MAEMSAKQSRDGLDYANQVAELALRAPHTFSKKVMLQAVDKMRRTYGFSDERKRELIRTSIEHGCTTYHDISNDVFLPKYDVIKLVKDMENHGEVTLHPLARGDQGGRPMVYIQLTGRSSRKMPEK